MPPFPGKIQVPSNTSIFIVFLLSHYTHTISELLIIDDIADNNLLTEVQHVVAPLGVFVVVLPIKSYYEEMSKKPPKPADVSQDNWRGFFKSVSAVNVREKKITVEVLYKLQETKRHVTKCKYKFIDWTLGGDGVGKQQGLVLGQMGKCKYGHVTKYYHVPVSWV